MCAHFVNFVLMNMTENVIEVRLALLDLVLCIGSKLLLKH